MAGLNFDIIKRVAADAVQAANSPSGRSTLVTTAAVVLGLATIPCVNRLASNYSLGNTLFASTPLASTAPEWSDWSKEIVLITGGSSGIGRIMVQEFARRGVKLVVLDRQRPLESGVDGPFPGPDQGVHFYEFDLTAPDSELETLAARIRREVGEPTVVINNAGIGHGLSLLEATNDQMRLVFAINAIAPIRITREFLPSMIRKKHGHIVNVASMASFVTIASNVDYSCTKAGLLAFHEGLTQELKHRYRAPEIRTTIVHPHFVKTPLLGAAATDSDATNSARFQGGLLDANTVAIGVVNQVLAGRSGQLFYPPKFASGTLIRAMPTWLQEHIRGTFATVFVRPMAMGEKK
ncbi:hypothetical protein HMPREF1624_06245 [Sporothrix schenckii ATCC 58251]|uniref:Short-chain dehydrogenase/reductase 3 n=1 Tax=Sporothrix schenckii (strain ATCC 58251 / de Perez 2211183) TaxID=1391915 RepID=U7PMT0_SPOS1|nr:hypothetical protein HMPREF1624_06245 [Sporothrix schenckii ATCC 58251]